MKVLQIDSSITGGQSVSRQLTAGVVTRLREVAPGLELTYRDLVAEPVPHQSPAVPSPERDAVFAQVLDEFLAADVIVIGAPMYNFAIPSQLKAWIDCLAVAGKTFRYSDAGVEGLAGDKRLIIASSRGGIYTAPSPSAPYDHQETYLSGFFGFIGVRQIEFVRAEGVMMGPEQRQRSVEAALADAASLQAA